MLDGKDNIRYVTPDDIGELVDFVSIDVAFISLTKVLEPVKALMKENAQIVCLIKPQFEAGREQVGKKGVVREPRVHEEVIQMVMNYALSLGFHILGLTTRRFAVRKETLNISFIWRMITENRLP